MIGDRNAGSNDGVFATPSAHLPLPESLGALGIRLEECWLNVQVKDKGQGIYFP